MIYRSTLVLGASAFFGLSPLMGQSENFIFEPYVGYGSGFTAGGETKVTSAGALSSAAKSSGNKIVISGKISNALIVCGSNKHFFGDGTAELEKVSFLIKDASNVTIQNIKMHLPYPGAVSGQDHDGDLIHIEGSGAKNIWIDHCDLSNELTVDDKDAYDGLIDCKNGASNITVSWNYIHDAWKTSLVGHTDKDNGGDWNLSIHHNLFNNLGSRIPSMRGGKAAVFNNYYLLVTTSAINSRLGAEIYAEKNFFDGVGSGKEEDLGFAEGPLGAYYSNTPGTFNSVDNFYVRCMGSQPTNDESTTKYKPPFLEGNNSLIDVMDVPEVILEKAGVMGRKKVLTYPDSRTTLVVPRNQSRNQKPHHRFLYNVLGSKTAAKALQPPASGGQVYFTMNGGVFRY